MGPTSDVREEILSAIKEESGELVVIKPFKYDDKLSGHKLAIELSPYYSKLFVDDKVYFFNRETGEFDGTSIPMGDKDN